METTVNNELFEVFSWLCANKLSLNIEKSRDLIFCTPQNLVNYSTNLKINNQVLMHKNCIKYLGIMIYSHLNWKSQVSYISKTIKRNIGNLSKIRHYVNLKTLTNLCHSCCGDFVFLFASFVPCLRESKSSTNSPTNSLKRLRHFHIFTTISVKREATFCHSLSF